MRRRTFLGGVAALSAGCVAPARSAADRPDGRTGTGGIPTTATDDGGVVLRFRVVNDADDRRRVTVEATRTATPECRYSDPPCAAPSRVEALLSETLDLGTGASATRTARASLSGDVDTFSVEATTDGGASDALAGLAAGDRVPEVDPADYPWRVAPGRYEVLVRVGGDVTVAVGG